MFWDWCILQNLGLHFNQKWHWINLSCFLSGIMLGTVGLIMLVAVLIIVVKRYRRLPVATRVSNPQTPTHVSFSTNIDNPPQIKLHRRKILGKISLKKFEKKIYSCFLNLFNKLVQIIDGKIIFRSI